MKRCASLFLAIALAACGGGSKGDTSTTPGDGESTDPAAPVAGASTPNTPPAPTKAPEPTYLPGKWVWFELNTSDVEKAKAFYGPLLGWTINSQDIGGQTFNSIVVGGKPIGLVQPLPADAKAKKMTTSWMGYISVSDVDAAVSTATGKGAVAVLTPMDMPEVGRFAVLTDPVGAPFGVVKTARGDDADKLPGNGEFIWIEHWSKDQKKVADAAGFYAAVAGYQNETMPMGKEEYTMASASGSPRMGFSKAAKASAGNRFVPYVVVADTDATVKAATKARGKVVMKAMDIPNVGRVAVIADPQGALLGVMTPEAQKPDSGPVAPAAPAADAGKKPN